MPAEANVPSVVHDALNAIATRQGIRKPRFHIESGSGARDGFMSTVFRATLTDEDAPDREGLDIICKTSMPVMKGIMDELFVAEGFMYRTALPAIEGVLSAKRALEPVPWPRCYHVAVQGAPPHCIAMENLRTQGFVTADRNGLDADHCRLALQVLAKIHGASLAMERHSPDTFNKIKSGVENVFFSKEVKVMMDPFFADTLRLMDTITDRFPRGSAVHDAFKRIFEHCAEGKWAHVMCPSHQGETWTIIHGDAQTNNMFFKYDKDTGAVKECKLYDFQTSCYSSPAFDIGRLLIICTEKDVRDKHFQDLQRGYLRELHATLLDAGCKDPEAMFSWETLQAQMRRFAPGILALAPIFFNVFYSDDDTLAAHRQTMAETGVVNSNEPKQIYAVTPEFKRRMVNLVQDLVDWGWMPTAEEVDRWMESEVAAHQVAH